VFHFQIFMRKNFSFQRNSSAYSLIKTYFYCRSITSEMKKILLFGLLIVLLVLGYIVYVNYPKLNIITGFAAKNVCSCVFEAERSLETVEMGDNNFDPVNYATNKINYDQNSVTSTVFGLKSRTAVFKNGFGCILLPEDLSEESIAGPIPDRDRRLNNSPYPFGSGDAVDTVFTNIDYDQLQRGVDEAFDTDREEIKKTRAVLVLYKDHLIAEKYAPEFTKETKLLGWSMTKSITSAVLGVMEKQGKITLEQNNLFPEWENDERAGITLDHMLQMSSGLEWEEDYSTISDVTKMLFLAEDMTKVQLNKPLLHEPGEVWNYSSGTTNLLSGFIRDQFTTHQEYLNFWYSELIDKVGMTSMTLEPDVAGNFVGSSYSWATARDWAKFGLLYLHKGNWNGDQVLNKSWVEYTIKPAKGAEGEYGGHFWLNAESFYPNLPRDLFSANGFQGQHVFVIPSKELVVVRFGLVEHPEFDIDVFLKEILSAIK